ncbi:putative ribonuclease H-like domain-containing protein [Tanacetum coccineum]
MEYGSEKMMSPEKIEEKDADTQKEVKEVTKESGAKRKKSLPRKRRIVKRQKLEEDAKKEELKGFLDIIPREEFAEDVESLSTKGDGSSKNYKVLSEMLEDFDRQDVEELYRLVKERPKAVVSDKKGNKANAVKASACWVWRPKQKCLDHEKGVIDSGCSSHMTGNKSYLSDYKEIDDGFVAFGGDPKGGKITGKGKISTCKLDFEDVYFVKELKFNLFSVSQMCDKKNSVLFTDTECVVLSLDFKLLDENHVLLRVPRKDNMYSIDLKNIVPSGGESDQREFSVARTPQQNGVAERKNRTLIEAARTMLADSKLATTFWAEAVNTACYVQNRVLVIKPHNKTPYELFLGRKPALSFMRPFGYPVTILNTLDHLGKFDGKADEGFFVGYFTNSKAFRVFNSRTRIVEENLHVKFSEETPNIAGNRPNWLFDIDALTISMNYKPVVAGNQTNGNAGTKENIDACQDRKKIVPDQEYILLSLLPSDPSPFKSLKDSPDAGFKLLGEEEKIDSKHLENEGSEVPNIEEPSVNQEQDANVNSTNNVNTVYPTVNAADIENNAIDENIVYGCINDPNMPNLEDIVYSDDDEEVGAEADMNNLAITVPVSPIPTTRVNKDHPLEQIIRDIHLARQTRRMTKNVTEHVARIEAIMLFLAYASFMNFIVYQMDVRSAFLYSIIKEEVYVCQPLGFEDPEFPNNVSKVEKALYGFIKILEPGELTFFLGLQVKQKDDGIFISQDKYVADILKKFDFATVKTTSTPIETNKALLKDEEAEDVDVHLYRSMIGSLMYLTASMPNIMFTVCACACARFQVTPKVSHLHVVKRIFRYLKGQSKLGLWYPRDSPFGLEAFSDSDYAGASIDRKSTTGGCQFLGRRLISWQCKKQTIVANSTTEAEYVTAAN